MAASSLFSPQMDRNFAAVERKFFKVIMPGFEEKLKLPPTFCKEIKQEKSKTAILESRKGRWEVEVCRKCGGNEISFEDGWPRFAHDHALTVGDFVVFERTRRLHFKVYVFDPSACEKQFPADSSNRHHSLNSSPRPRQKPKNEKPVVSVHRQRQNSRYFTLKLSPYAATGKAVLYIPIEFIRSNNLGQKRSVTLRVSGRRSSWEVKLLNQTYYGLNSILSNGWHDFYVSNELQVGDVCRFVLDLTSLDSASAIFDVQFVRNTNGSSTSTSLDSDSEYQMGGD